MSHICDNLFAGIISGKIGRRKTLICSIAAYSLLTIPIYFSTSFAKFAFFRVLAGGGFVPILAANIFMGFAINYAITAVQPLMAEGYPTEFRNTGAPDYSAKQSYVS